MLMDAKAITVKRITAGDLDLIRPWYVVRDGEMPSLDLLPMETGFMFYVDNAPVGVGFLLLTNTKLALLEFMQTNHEMPVATQSRVLRHMVLFFEEMAKKIGFAVILGFVPADHVSLAKFYVRQNAALAKKQSILVWKRLE